MTTFSANLHTNKRKFLSDVEGYSPSQRFLPTPNQAESNSLSKKIKPIEREYAPTTNPPEVDETEDMIVCENSTVKHNDTANTFQPELISNVNSNTMQLPRRCYCGPYRLDTMFPYDLDIY